MKLTLPATLRERIADELRASILKGDLSPGSELKQDRLAEQFGVSRIPIREALLMLEHDGLVLAKPNRRVVVAAMTDEDILDHYAVRALVEGEAAARAAVSESIDLSSLTTATQRNEEVRQSGDLTMFLSASEVFHRAIWDAAGGVHLKNVANQLWSGRDYTPEYLPEQLERASEEHQLICEALCLRSPEKARQTMTEHIMRTAEELQTYRTQVAANKRVTNERGNR